MKMTAIFPAGALLIALTACDNKPEQTQSDEPMAGQSTEMSSDMVGNGGNTGSDDNSDQSSSDDSSEFMESGDESSASDYEPERSKLIKADPPA